MQTLREAVDQPKALSAISFGNLNSPLAIVSIARIVETYRYMGQTFVRIGLLYDSVCYRGSYEMIVCPYTLPPYETYLVILAIVLLMSLWASSRKH